MSNSDERKRSIDDEFYSDAPLSPEENRRMRRLLEEDAWSRRTRTTIRVWVYTAGAVLTLAGGFKVVVWDTWLRGFFK